MHFSLNSPPPAHSPIRSRRSGARAARRQEFDAPEPIVPDGCVEIVFNLGDRFIKRIGEPQPRDLLAGQMTQSGRRAADRRCRSDRHPLLAGPCRRGVADADVGAAGSTDRRVRRAARYRSPRSTSCETSPPTDRLDHLATALARRFRTADADRMRAVDRCARDHRIAPRHVAIDRAGASVSASRGGTSSGSFGKKSGLPRSRWPASRACTRCCTRCRQQPSLSGAEIAADVRLQRSGALDSRMPGAHRPDAGAAQDVGRSLAGRLRAHCDRATARQGLMREGAAS